MQRKASSTEYVQQLMASWQAKLPPHRGLAVAIANGPQSKAQATSARGVVWAEAGPGQILVRRNND